MSQPGGGEELLSGAWKAPGGLIRVDAHVSHGRLHHVRITGDFFIYPDSALEELEGALDGMPLERLALETAVGTVLSRSDVEAVGFGPEDVVNAILGTGQRLDIP